MKKLLLMTVIVVGGINTNQQTAEEWIKENKEFIVDQAIKEAKKDFGQNYECKEGFDQAIEKMRAFLLKLSENPGAFKPGDE